MTERKKDLVSRVVSRALLPARLSREVAAGAARLTPGGLFGPEFYEEVRRQAAQWQSYTGTFGQVAVLAPAGLFAASAGLNFPDLDIPLLGIGAHRFFFFHSGLGVWLLKKVHEAALAWVGDGEGTWDVVVRKIVGVALAGLAVGVGIHLILDAFNPKAVIFPFLGSLVDGTPVDDSLWLLGNAVWCFKMAYDFFVLALGENLSQVRQWVRENFGHAWQEGLRNTVSGRLG